MCCRSKHVWVVSLEDQVMRCKSCEVISMKGHGICFVLGSCRHPPGVILAASEQQTGASDASSAPSALSAVRCDSSSGGSRSHQQGPFATDNDEREE
jgi:hypothetical protein